MAIIGSGVTTLIDVLKLISPDGKELDIAEVLKQDNEVLNDMNWMEGNLKTGHRDAVRTALPTPTFRAINEGVPLTKGATTPIEETCALLEDWSLADRELAIMSGNIDNFRLREGVPHMQGMSNTMAQTLFYGNTGANPKAFTGMVPRYNSLSTMVSQTANNVINAGGTGSLLNSIWLIGWGPQTVTGLYPQGTKGGLLHEDMTSQTQGSAANGGGAVVLDANGNRFVGFQDHWMWRCGLMVKDWRYAVRIANVNPQTLTYNAASGALIQDLMVQALERIQTTTGVKAAFYMPRLLKAFLRRQLLSGKNAFLSLNDAAGEEVMTFGGVPVRRTDALNVFEQQVT